MEEQLMNMSDTFISFETAKLGKEKGFNIECLNFYTKPNSKMFGINEHGRSYPIQNSTKNKIYTIGNEATLNFKNVLFAPTQSLLQKWIREVYGVHIQVYVMEQWLENGNEMEIYFEVNLKTTQNIGGLKNVKSNMIKFKSYEEALEVGLQEALRLIE